MAIAKPQEEPREIAAKALLTLKQQYGGMIGHLARVFGSEELVWLILRNDQASPLAELTPKDVPFILEKLEELRRACELQAAAPAAPVQSQSLEGVF